MYSAFFIRYADEAIDDLKEIRSYYDEINPAITERFREELLRTEAGILANPFAYSRFLSRISAERLLKNSLIKLFTEPKRISFMFLVLSIFPGRINTLKPALRNNLVLLPGLFYF